MSGKSTPPEAHSDPRGSPALSTPPSALEDAGSPHEQPSKSNPRGGSKPSSAPPPLTRPTPQNPTSGQSKPDQGGHLSRAAMISRFGGPPPRFSPPVSPAQAEAFQRSVPALPALTKWSKWIGVFSWVTCASVGTWMVLFMPLGDKETVFHPVRRKVFSIWDRLNGTYDEAKYQAQLEKARQDWAEMEARHKIYVERRKAEGSIRMPS